jgi:hypothetical protein
MRQRLHPGGVDGVELGHHVQDVGQVADVERQVVLAQR